MTKLPIVLRAYKLYTIHKATIASSSVTTHCSKLMYIMLILRSVQVDAVVVGTYDDRYCPLVFGGRSSLSTTLGNFYKIASAPRRCRPKAVPRTTL